MTRDKLVASTIDRSNQPAIKRYTSDLDTEVEVGVEFTLMRVLALVKRSARHVWCRWKQETRCFLD